MTDSTQSLVINNQIERMFRVSQTFQSESLCFCPDNQNYKMIWSIHQAKARLHFAFMSLVNKNQEISTCISSKDKMLYIYKRSF